MFASLDPLLRRVLLVNACALCFLGLVLFFAPDEAHGQEFTCEEVTYNQRVILRCTTDGSGSDPSPTPFPPTDGVVDDDVDDTDDLPDPDDTDPAENDDDDPDAEDRTDSASDDDPPDEDGSPASGGRAGRGGRTGVGEQSTAAGDDEADVWESRGDRGSRSDADENADGEAISDSDTTDDGAGEGDDDEDAATTEDGEDDDAASDGDDPPDDGQGDSDGDGDDRDSDDDVSTESAIDFDGTAKPDETDYTLVVAVAGLVGLGGLLWLGARQVRRRDREEAAPPPVR